MATSEDLSKSIKLKGQKVLTCRLCETDPKIKWKCIECKLLMCHRCCEKVHSKFASASDHTILDIKDLDKHPETDEKVDFSKLKCKEHSGQQCFLFCQSCDILVCSTCVAKTHKKHELVEIEEGYQSKVVKVGELKLNLRKLVESLKEDEQVKLRKTKYLHRLFHLGTKRAIEDQKQAIIKLAEEYAQNLQDENDKHYKNVLKDIETEENQNEKTIKTAQQKQEELDNLISMKDTVNNIFTQKDPFNMPSKLCGQQYLQMLPTLKLVSGELTSIPSIFGKLQNDKLSKLNATPKIVKTYTSSLGICTEVIAYDYRTFWINDWMDNECLQHINLQTEAIKILQEFKLSGRPSFLRNGDLLVALIDYPVLKLLPKGSKELKDSVFDVSPYNAGSIHVNRHNDQVIIGCQMIDETGTDLGQVVVMDEAGHKEKVYQYDTENKPLFTFPCSICCTSQGRILVGDLIEVGVRGQVIILDQQSVRNRYNGHSSINNQEKPFMPFSIKATPSDNFVVIDPNNFCLHILNDEGDLLTLIETSELGIEQKPFSLSCLCFAGNMFIGCGSRSEEEGAKIYVLENFVW